MTKRPDVKAVMSQLKDFQRSSVEYAFRRLYSDADHGHRFLVADEVGLGKTLVARGLIAKALDHLWDDVKRLDVVYICSNGDIARQNVSRLDVLGEKTPLPTRLTLLPRQVRDLRRRRVNFVSLTPTTSFDLKSALGTAEERALLYWMVRDAWDIRGKGPINLMQGWVLNTDRFRRAVREVPRRYELDTTMKKLFTGALRRHVKKARQEGTADIRSRFDDLCDRFHRTRKNVPQEDRRDQALIIGELRGLLAEACLESLEPDLIILDEFQRFKNLLSLDNDAGRLAKGLFEYADEESRARVILLSATPYKMYTMGKEPGDDDHYRDFLETLQFLLEDDDELERIRSLLASYRSELFRVDKSSSHALGEVSGEITDALRKVMTRTERLATSSDRDGMLREVPPQQTRLESQDLRAYVDLQDLARFVGHPDTMEFWKSAPYLLSFMEKYTLKTAFKRVLDDDQTPHDLKPLLDSGGAAFLSWDDVEAYKALDPANARLRGLLAEMVDSETWKLLWAPPSMPYYELAGAFADEQLAGFTKRLVFSSWVVVPRVISCLVSYEAERRMVRLADRSPRNSLEARRRRRQLLRFTRDDGRLSGMPVLALLYPSPSLAELGDPLPLANRPDALESKKAVLTLVAGRIEERLQSLPTEASSEGAEDEAWYWVAPILLDMATNEELTQRWWGQDGLARLWAGDAGPDEGGGEDSLWSEHVDQARQVLAGWRPRGRAPSDLSAVLAELALGGPAVTALRALGRLTEARTTTWGMNAAGSVAGGFRTLFNIPEVMALLRGLGKREDTPYWRKVLNYSVDGGLGSVLDEYAHVLRESLGLIAADPERIASEVGAAMRAALTIRTPTLRVDVLRRESETPLQSEGMRGRFALRFGKERDEVTGEMTREDQVRSAFNSPFWPFVLATTSVGQEGLDFHPYCHAVVHWNLPSNPVDLEQREGRIHRYKGHAVRKNLVARYRHAFGSGHTDPWQAMFEAAHADQDQETLDIIPYWVLTSKGGAAIERHVPALPLSRDRQQLEGLKRSLTVYRMVFGQPHQEDLLEFLLSRFSQEEARSLLNQFRIDLSPPRIK